jgi:hypothetical protein
MEPRAGAPDYPVRFDVDHPETVSRLTTLLRLIWVIPLIVVVSLVGSVTFPALLVVILLCEKYPRWWFDWNLELTRSNARISAHGALLTDRYPATHEEQAVHLEIEYPDAERDLMRGMPLVKWFLAIPHLLILLILWPIAVVLIVIAWFAILFTGRYPRGIFDFVVGFMRWGQRVNGYVFLLVTDRYPPFSLR